jgi:integrase/recombinase XerC
MSDAYAAILQPFLDHLKFEKRYAQHTIIAYQNDLAQFFAYLASQFDTPPLETITAMYIRSWLAEMKEEGLTAKSLNRKISALKSFFKYQLKTGVLATSPMATIVTPKVRKRLPAFVAELDMETLFAHIEFPDNWKGKTERLVLQLFYSTGMRLSELVHLKESQLDPSLKHIVLVAPQNYPALTTCSPLKMGRRYSRAWCIVL